MLRSLELPSRRSLLAILFALGPAACGKAADKQPQRQPPPPAATALAAPAATGYRLYRDPAGRFSCEAPSSWEDESDSGTQTPNVSFTLRGVRPDDARKAAIYTLSVNFFSRGNEEFPSADDFVRRNTQGLPGAEIGPVREARMKDQTAKRWTATLPPLSFPDGPDGKKIKDTFVVLPAPSGFFVLNYTSPADLHAAHQEAFDRLLQTFSAGSGDRR